MVLLILLIVITCPVIVSQSDHAFVTGKVINFSDKLPLINANIFVESLTGEKQISTGTVSDSSGGFKIVLPYGNYTLTASYVGFITYKDSISLSAEKRSVEIIIELKTTVISSAEVTVTSERKFPSTVIQEIEPKDLERIPTIYSDVLRAVQILPGVTTGSELSSGYNVRGGNFDDNLIYLNGFEIYRPFLLRQGIEENKSLINPDLVEEFRFYNGSFPASYGDKMSSALEVNYRFADTDTSNGIVKADLLGTSLMLRKKFSNLRFEGAVRYAYPGLFLNELQTNGDYKPSFKDVQLFANYSINSMNNLEVLFLYADNKFDLTPRDWTGHFGGFFPGDIRELDIFYNGERNYSFITGLTGIKYSYLLNENIQLILSVARYDTEEKESSDLYSEYYYKENPESNYEGEFLKSALENVNNNLNITSYELNPGLKIKEANHLLDMGVNIRLTNYTNKVNEFFSESSDTLISVFPSNRFIDAKFKLNSYSAFVQDEFRIFETLFVNAGIRTNYYEYNKEFLISPRTSFVYIPSIKHSFTLSWGYYYQPPYYAELRNKDSNTEKKLNAQRSIHYSAGWEYRFKEKLKLNVEAYYKDLDYLIPYYIDREKTEYLDENNNEGFAYGFDVMVQGEIVEGMNSWLGYSYLDTQERTKLVDGTYTAYHRRLPDQTHTLQIFLQDKIRKHPNWQAHTRLLFGSGHLYNLRELVTDPESGKSYLKPSVDKLDEFFLYFRVDMGLSASFDFGNAGALIAIIEVLNVFNHNNYGGYNFVQIPEDPPITFSVPKILSKRFFNVGVEYKF